jgi:hypothetical protein
MRKLKLAAGLAFLAALLASSTGLSAALELHDERASPYDLALKGSLQGVPAGETRYLRRADLETLPSRSLTVTGEFVPGEQTVTIVMLDDLLARLPRTPDADTVIATCTDGYASLYTHDWIASYKPFLVLQINGQGPDHWPPPGMKFNPGPFVISVADELASGVSTQLDIGHKRPWGMDTLELANYAARFAPLLSAPPEALPPLVAEGRTLWVNSCFSCHEAPGATSLGGTKAARPLPILAMHATYNPAFFKTYVRTPTAMNPAAKMEPHPHYTDAQLDALIAFLKRAATP